MRASVIVAAKRTPQGRFLGALASLSAVDLACRAGAAAVAAVGAAHVDLVILGNVLGAGLGMNIARQVGMRIGLPESSPAFTINMMCGSGLQAVMLAARAVGAGEADVVLCGGTESMSNAPYVLERARAGLKLGDATLVDTLLRDGLLDAFDHQHMGITAERVAREYAVSRESQDAFAVESQRRHSAAKTAGVFTSEIVPVDGLDADEHPRPDTTVARLAALPPAFMADGTVTAGNASGVNDGAAMLVVAAAEVARARGWPVLAEIEGAAAVGCDPKLMGLGPVHAVRRLCGLTGKDVGDYDLVEINEAFAAQALACSAVLGLDPARVNASGGSIAVGHPIGASGARLVVHLAHRLKAAAGHRALAALCVGGGMGVAMALRRP